MNSAKYGISDNQIYNRHTHQPIPENEPVFILRAKDRKALAALSYYFAILNDLNHIASVKETIESFRAFECANPEKMKEPDTPMEYS